MARPVILLEPFDAEQALRVFRNIDIHDLMECDVMAGQFRVLEAVARRLVSLPSMYEAKIASVLRDTGVKVPFAMLCLGHSGYVGVAGAEFLSCNHQNFRRELAQLVLMTKALLPEIADKHDLNRIEFRSWSRHPSAHLLGAALGFSREAISLGFGGQSPIETELWAWVRPEFQQPSIQTGD